jgi:cytochrome c biogenesis protein CcmG, thiol:disulfide interchange protein DsbE
MATQKRVLGAAVLFFAVAALVHFGLKSSPKPAGGRRAPALPGEVLAGSRVTLSSLLAGARGGPVVVVFWASWCGPCHQEAAAVERFSNSAQGHGRIVAVDWNDGLGEARAFVRHYHWTFPVLRDGEGLTGDSYHLVGLPATFVITPQGRIRELLSGPQTEATLTHALRSA